MLKQFKPKEKNEEETYMGNVFGWKVSIIGLIVLVASIILAVGIYWYRASNGTLDNYPSLREGTESTR